MYVCTWTWWRGGGTGVVLLTRFVGEQVGDAAQLLGDGAGPHHRAGDLGVLVDHPAEHHLPQIQIHAQTGTEEES